MEAFEYNESKIEDCIAASKSKKNSKRHWQSTGSLFLEIETKVVVTTNLI